MSDTPFPPTRTRFQFWSGACAGSELVKNLFAFLQAREPPQGNVSTSLYTSQPFQPLALLASPTSPLCWCRQHQAEQQQSLFSSLDQSEQTLHQLYFFFFNMAVTQVQLVLFVAHHNPTPILAPDISSYWFQTSKELVPLQSKVSWPRISSVAAGTGSEPTLEPPWRKRDMTDCAGFYCSFW